MLRLKYANNTANSPSLIYFHSRIGPLLIQLLDDFVERGDALHGDDFLMLDRPLTEVDL